MTTNEYAAISNDVWQVFKKYYPADVNLNELSDDVHALDQKYHEMNNLEAYGFMQKLLKVYFDELGRIKR